MVIRSFSFALACALLVAGCGKTSDPATSPIDAFQVVNQGTLTTSTASLSGTGSVVFVNPLAGTTAKSSFRLTFSLANDTSSLQLTANANAQLQNGALVSIVRNGAALKVGSLGNEQTVPGVDASQTVTLQIDVHNDETPAHVQVWKADVTTFTTPNATPNIDSTDPNAVPHGTGGTAWGLLLNNATVTGALASAAKNPNA